MRRISLFLLFALACVKVDVAVERQERLKGFDKETWKRLFGETAVEGEAYANLRHLCDRIGGRLSCTESGRRAEEFAYQRLLEYGLANVHYEPFTMLAWERGDLTVQLIAPVRKRLDAIALGHTPSGDAEGEVVDVGHGTPGEFEKTKVKGRIALVRHGAPPGHRSVHRSEKMTLASDGGALAMVLVNGTPGNVPQAGTCSIGKISSIPGIGVSREQGEWLARLLASGEVVRLAIAAKASHGDREARNVVGEITGSSREVVLIGAHLDSWDLAQGAIDNGVGSAVVLEAARALAALKVRPARTLRFVLFMGEEFGLYGSKEYVRRHEAELDDVVMMINLDMVGLPNGYELYACDEALPFFEPLTRELARSGMTVAPTSKAGLHSDHQPFMLAGVPAMSLKSTLDEEMGKYYHSAGDTFNLAKEEYLNRAAVVCAVTMWELSRVRERPVKRLTLDTVRARMIRDGVKEALELGGEWPFK